MGGLGAGCWHADQVVADPAEDLVLVMLGAMLALVIYWQLVETEDVGIGMIDHH